MLEPMVAIGRQAASSGREAALKEAAVSLEAQFLAEMLKSAGVGKTPEAFGGGMGEDQFGSFLREAQARQMAEAGGIGLAQALFEAMAEEVQNADR